MKISLKELKAAIAHIEANSNDMSLTIKDEHKSIKIIVGSKYGGSLIEYELYDEDIGQFAKVRETKELLFK